MAKNAQDFEQRPWGTFQVIHEFQVADAEGNREDVIVKKIEVFPGKRLSYQSHKFRAETWCIAQGSGIAVLDEKEIPIKAGDVVHVPIGVKHRVANTGQDVHLVAIEIGRGQFDEFDNTRYEDDFGRA